MERAVPDCGDDERRRGPREQHHVARSERGRRH